MYTNMNNPFRNSKPPLLWGCLQRVKHIHHHLHLFNQHRSFECSFLLHELYYYLSSTSSFSTAFLYPASQKVKSISNRVSWRVLKLCSAQVHSSSMLSHSRILFLFKSNISVESFLPFWKLCCFPFP